MTDPIVLVVVCDNHYTILLAALLKSIELNHKSNERIVVYIIEDGIFSKNKTKLINSFHSETFDFRWLSLADAIPEGIELPLDNSSWPLNMYGRLFIPHFIESGMQKVIYLDVDMIMEVDISELWNVHLKGNIVGAVQDPRILTFNNSWGGIRNHVALKLHQDTKYFNTGLLVIDIEEWRRFKVGEKVVDCITQYTEFANFPDQYGLNIVLVNNWLELSPLWNHFADSKTKVKPKIIHYIAKKPIYKYTNALPEYREVFYNYLKNTEWKDFKSRGSLDIYIKKARNKIIKKLRKIFR